MRYYDYRQMSPWGNMPGYAMPYSMMPEMQAPYMGGNMGPSQNRTYAPPLRYPEVYYILQPHIMKAADQLELYGQMPTESLLEAMTDEIEKDVTRLHPELAEHAGMMEENMHTMHADMMEDHAYNMPANIAEESMPNMHGKMAENTMPNMYRDIEENVSLPPEKNKKEEAFPARFEDYNMENIKEKCDFPGSGYPGRNGMQDMRPMHSMLHPMRMRRPKGLLNDLIRILLLSELFRRRRRRRYY